MQRALVVDISPADLPILKRFGIGESQFRSWNPERRRRDEFTTFLRENLGHTLGQFELVQFEHAVGKQNTFEDYLTVLFEAVHSHMTSIATSAEPIAHLVLNLMPYHLSITLADKIAAALTATFGKAYGNSKPVCLILTRNVDWFAKSIVFDGLTNKSHFFRNYIVIDIRGYKLLFTRDAPPVTQMLSADWSRLVFFHFDENSFYKELIYETNSFIGHFVLNTAHVRTHYDFSDFVIRDDVIEYLAALFSKQVKNSEPVGIVGVGLEESAVHRLGLFLAGRYAHSVRGFEFVKPIAGGLGGVTSLLGCQSFVILTDMVNTGATIAAAIGMLKNSGETSIIKIFTIAKMRNSPAQIDGVTVNAAVTINRDFYPTDPESCPLCQIAQPQRRVERSEDFAFVDPRQPTPLDFWELVKDANALQEYTEDLHGRKLVYRIDTNRILKRFRFWLRNIATRRFQQTWPSVTPAAICTLDEEPGRNFATLVAESLHVKNVILIRREDIRKATPAGVPGANPFQEISARVLLVDDGINSGATLEALITFCRSWKVSPMGAMVFDNRLSENELRRLEGQMGGQRILTLYTWQNAPVVAAS